MPTSPRFHSIPGISRRGDCSTEYRHLARLRFGGARKKWCQFFRNSEHECVHPPGTPRERGATAAVGRRLRARRSRRRVTRSTSLDVWLKWKRETILGVGGQLRSVASFSGKGEPWRGKHRSSRGAGHAYTKRSHDHDPSRFVSRHSIAVRSAPVAVRDSARSSRWAGNRNYRRAAVVTEGSAGSRCSGVGAPDCRLCLRRQLEERCGPGSSPVRGRCGSIAGDPIYGRFELSDMQCAVYHWSRNGHNWSGMGNCRCREYRERA
jgi:hypothetical protein